jgi:Family of unknown function (DUF5681)
MADLDDFDPDDGVSAEEPAPETEMGGDGNRNKDRTYDVGYGKPPRKNQFEPGKSGNPRGRPKGAKGLRSELKAELDEFVTITENGKPRRIRKRRLVIKALAQKAAKGNVAAADKLLSLVIQAEGFEDERTSRRALSDADTLILERFLAEHDEPSPEAAGDEDSSEVPTAEEAK